MQGMMDYDRDIEGKQNLGGREMLSCMRKGIYVCVVVVLMLVVGVDSVVVVVEIEVDNLKLGMECVMKLVL